MPCYTQWNHYLVEGTPAYPIKKKELEAKFFALKYVVDYYFAAFKKSIPTACYGSCGMRYDINSESDPLTGSEWDALCMHIAYDSVHCSDIYDIETCLNREVALVCGYAAVLITCANRLRSDGERFNANLIVEKWSIESGTESKYFAGTPR